MRSRNTRSPCSNRCKAKHTYLEIESLEQRQLLASDIVIIPPNELPLEGKKAVRSYYQKVFSKSETNQLFFYMETLEAVGKLGHIQGRVVEINASGEWEDRFSFSMILQGSYKGSWEIYRFLWY